MWVSAALRAGLHTNTPTRSDKLHCGLRKAGPSTEKYEGRTAVAVRPWTTTKAVGYFMCLLTSFVISNIETLFLPPNTARSLSSALIMRRSR